MRCLWIIELYENVGRISNNVTSEMELSVKWSLQDFPKIEMAVLTKYNLNMMKKNRS